MANNEFKTAAAKLLEQNGVKGLGAEAGRVENAGNAGNAGNVMLAGVQIDKSVHRENIPITLPLLISLATTKLSLGLALLCCAVMWLVVPELLIPKSFKVFNAVLGIIIGLTYGVILTFPQSREGGMKP